MKNRVRALYLIDFDFEINSTRQMHQQRFHLYQGLGYQRIVTLKNQKNNRSPSHEKRRNVRIHSYPHA